MKKLKYFFLWLVLISILGAGCGKKEPAADTPESKTLKAIVLESDTALLVSPDKDSDEYKSSDQISVDTKNAGIYDKDGEKTELKDILPGDIVEITYNGIIMESYPAQISSGRIQVMETLLTDGYLAIIDDIYNESKGLNADLETMVIDTTDISDLPDLEKEKLLMKLKGKYGLEVREGTYDQLVKEGLIDEKHLYFEKGVLIRITDAAYNESRKEITCGISKWKSGLGAVGSDDVTARLKGENWIVKKRGIWIS